MERPPHPPRPEPRPGADAQDHRGAAPAAARRAAAAAPGAGRRRPAGPPPPGRAPQPPPPPPPPAPQPPPPPPGASRAPAAAAGLTVRRRRRSTRASTPWLVRSPTAGRAGVRRAHDGACARLRHGPRAARAHARRRAPPRARRRPALERVVLLRLLRSRRRASAATCASASTRTSGSSGTGPAWSARDRRLVTVIDHTVPDPGRRPASLEIRHDGLWADHNVETPFDHFSLGLEAFGLTLDDPGRRVHRRASARRPRSPSTSSGSATARCSATPTAAPLRDPVPGARRDPGGRRDHRARRLRPARPLVGPARLVGQRLVLDRVPHGGRRPLPRRHHQALDRLRHRLRPGARHAAGARLRPRHRVRRPTRCSGAAGIPIARRASASTTAPSTSSPSRGRRSCASHPDGREARFPRALARFTEHGGADDGRPGLGWIEFNQPPAPASTSRPSRRPPGCRRRR